MPYKLIFDNVMFFGHATRNYFRKLIWGRLIYRIGATAIDVRNITT